MIRGVLVVAALATLGACAVLGLPGRHPAPTAAERGHEVARRACAACHAVEPGSASPKARAPAFASLEMRHTAGLPDRVAELTRAGHYEMPPLKLTPDEVADLVSYIAGLDGR